MGALLGGAYAWLLSPVVIRKVLCCRVGAALRLQNNYDPLTRAVTSDDFPLAAVSEPSSDGRARSLLSNSM